MYAYCYIFFQFRMNRLSTITASYCLIAAPSPSPPIILIHDVSPSSHLHACLRLARVSTILQVNDPGTRLVHLICSNVGHVACGANLHALLRGALVGAHLQTNDALALFGGVINLLDLGKIGERG